MYNSNRYYTWFHIFILNLFFFRDDTMSLDDIGSLLEKQRNELKEKNRYM